MSIPARQLDLIPPEDYLAMDEASEDARLEYAAGHIFALAGANRRHGVIATNLVVLLHEVTSGGDCQVYAADMRLRVSDDLYFYPDVMVACGLRSGTDRDETDPVLLVEVLSGSTVHRDIGLKLAAYRAIPSLRAYLIVYQDERRVESHWREREDARWRHEVARGETSVHLGVLGGLEIPLSGVYARTEL